MEHQNTAKQLQQRRPRRGNSLESTMELGDFLQQLLGLVLGELHVAYVVDAVAVHVDVVVAAFRLHDVRAQQRMRHE